MHKPKLVKAGPLLENSTREVDLGRFPAPTWHRDDGGPYIGSGSIVVMRDPDTGWINASIYRVQVHGKDRVTVRYASPLALMHDLRRMGAANALTERRRTPLRRATLRRCR